MGLSFFESMKGHLSDKSGKPHLIDFDIKAEATHLNRLLRDGTTRITGIVRVRPWADDVSLDGTLKISPLRLKRIEYRFTFRDEDERCYQFFGYKQLNFKDILYSMTHMKAELRCEGELLAEGELLFDLNDLLSFANSWLLSTSVRSVDLGSKQSVSTPGLPIFDESARKTLLAYAEAIIAPGTHVTSVSGDTVDETITILAQMPAHVRALYRSLLSLIDLIALARHRRRFAKLSLGKRRSLALELNSQRPMGQGINYVLALPIKMAHFSERNYLNAIGVPIYEEIEQEPKTPWMSNVFVPEDLSEETTLNADVVIVGTGAGGGPMAALLAERGYAVAIVEEGLYERRSQFSGPPEKRLTRLWRDAGTTLSVGNLPILIPTGKLVGGSTAINSGTCFPTPHAVLQQWRTDYGLPDDFSPEMFGAHLQSVMTEIRVKPAEMKWVGDIADIVAKGADHFGAKHGPLPRNAPDCDGQGVCAIGCPTDAKRSTNISYIPRALKAGASLFTGMPVSRVLTRGRKAVAIEARGQDNNGAPRTLRIHAKAIVISCGTLASPLLLKDNGIKLPWLGNNLSVHPALGMFAKSPQIKSPWRAIPQSYGIEGLVDERVRFEGFYAPPQLSAPMFGMVGEELTKWMDAQSNLSQYGFMVRDPSVGSVMRGPGGQKLIRYNITEDVRELFQKGAAILAELMIRGGAEEVWAGVGPVGSISSIEEAKAIASLDLQPSDFRAMAFHPLGTCRMGPDSERGVVDFEHRVHGMDNLYVVDGSTVPTSLGVNPQVTIMAMAERAAIILAHRLEDTSRREAA